MEVIHQGTASVPSRERMPGRSQYLPKRRASLAPRAHGTAGSRPAWSPERRRKRQVRRGRTCRPGRPGGPAAPRPPPPRALCYSPTSCLVARPRLTPGPGSRRRPRVFGDSLPARPRLLLQPRIPPPAGEPALGRGRGKPSPAGHRADCLGPAARQQGRRAAAGPHLDRDRGRFALLGVSTSLPWRSPGRAGGRGQPDAVSVSPLSRQSFLPGPAP